MELNLKDLFKRILLQWRIFVIAMPVFAVVFTVMGVLTSRGVDLKLTVLGLLVGGFFVAADVCVCYVLTGKVRCASDMTEGFSIDLLGTVRSERVSVRFGGVDRFIERVFDGKRLPEETAVKLICTDIAMAVRVKGVDSIVFTGNVSDGVMQTIADGIAQLEGDDAPSILCLPRAIDSPDSLKLLLSAKSVLLLETVGKSTFADVERSLAYCERYSIPVLGAVLAE